MMTQAHPLAHIIHLICALILVGGVFFEVLVLRAMHDKSLPREARRAAERAIAARTVHVLPWVVADVFLSAYRYADLLLAPWTSAFGIQLA